MGKMGLVAGNWPKRPITTKEDRARLGWWQPSRTEHICRRYLEPAGVVHHIKRGWEREIAETHVQKVAARHQRQIAQMASDNTAINCADSRQLIRVPIANVRDSSTAVGLNSKPATWADRHSRLESYHNC